MVLILYALKMNRSELIVELVLFIAGPPPPPQAEIVKTEEEPMNASVVPGFTPPLFKETTSRGNEKSVFTSCISIGFTLGFYLDKSGLCAGSL